ncbi:MAG: photosynthetic reaction center subunit H [Geminicoccaceae bacterium]
MPTGALTGHIDVALVCLYLFWAFFAGLIYYLRREDQREGYDFEPEGQKGDFLGIFVPPTPTPKTFKLMHGGEVQAPSRSGGDTRPIKGAAPEPFIGSPLSPTGDNPMLDCIGPASYAERQDKPDLTYEGAVKIVPLRIANMYTIADEDDDPRGYKVIGKDGRVAGTLVEAWVDRAESLIRYYEVELDGGQHVMLPANFAFISPSRKEVTVDSIKAAQFAAVPALKAPDQITMLEEDMICAYYGGGYFYSDPSGTEPLL